MTMLRRTRRPTTDSHDAGKAMVDSAASGQGDRTQSTRGNAALQEQLTRSRQHRNPSDYTYDNGNRTVHAPVSADEALNADATADAPPERTPGDVEVRPRYTEEHPLIQTATPTDETLYERREPTGERVGDGWVLASGIMGSTARPSITRTRDERTIFINGTPSIEDIAQGSIGDCYFLAAVTTVAQSDPGHLRGLFTVNGDQVVVRLHSYDAATARWQPQAISVDMNFLHAADKSGMATDLISSGFRMGTKPTRSRWYVTVEAGEDLWVCEDAEYEFALWAPLLEKAYARLAERFGQYGGAYSNDANSNTDANGKARSGYQIIDGGYSQYIYGIL